MNFAKCVLTVSLSLMTGLLSLNGILASAAEIDNPDSAEKWGNYMY
jgi:hypothetical protein